MISAIGFILFLLFLIAGVALVIWIIRKLLRYGMNSLPTNTENSDQTTPSPINTRSNNMFDSLTLRSIIIGVLALVMLIPLALVGGVIDERGYRYRSVLTEIASTWGNQQTVLAPVLVVPFTEVIQVEETVTDNDGSSRIITKQVEYQRTAQFLPDELAIDVTIQDEFRRRGIFESLVYVAEIKVAAEFPDISLDDLSDKIQTIHWDKTWLSVGLSDTRAINSVSNFEWRAEQHELSPGTRLEYLPSGFHAKIGTVQPAATSQKNTLALTMNINGSGSFRFAPLGENTKVSMQSSWPHPSFQGNALPDEYDINETGFTASWDIPHLARNYPQRWSTARGQQDLYEFTAGVSMFEPLSLYSLITRSVKYGILFIGLTFLTLFIFELTIKRKLHVVQYALIGVALSLFYLVLLSLSEHIPFIKAYFSAATLTILMISCYTWVVLGSFARAMAVFIMLIALYSVLYSLLQLEDYALMMGTALLVFVVIILMFVTRNIQQDKEAGELPEKL